MTYGRCTIITCRYNVDRKCTDKTNHDKCIIVKHNDVLMRNIENRLIMDNVKEDEE